MVSINFVIMFPVIINILLSLILIPTFSFCYRVSYMYQCNLKLFMIVLLFLYEPINRTFAYNTDKEYVVFFMHP